MSEPTQPIFIQQPAHHQTHGNRALSWIVAGVATALVAAATVMTIAVATEDGDPPDAAPGLRSASASTTPIMDAFSSCGGEIMDDDTTLVLDLSGDDYDSGSETFDDLSCVVSSLRIPGHVVTKMGQTRAMDGMQVAQWTTDGDDFEASWTYHPDQGLDVIIHLQGK